MGSQTATAAPLVQVTDLKKHFPVRKGILSRVVGRVRAVDGVSFDLDRGETLGLVGESGCGKTTVGRTVLRLYEPTGGRVRFDGQDVFSLDDAPLRKLRRRMQIIFQDPFGSLNPRMKVADIVGEGLAIHRIGSRAERRDKVASLLERVGLLPEHGARYPHEFSGGQRQRIGIARALAVDPDFIVCDEAVSALDVSVQAQIINLLVDLQEELELAYLFISHDLSVVEHLCHRVAVMYLGRIVEEAPRDPLFDDPRHPYTLSLLSAIPVADPTRQRKRVILEGDVPSPMHPPSGCPFHPRCPVAEDRCQTEPPPLKEIGPDHFARCHFAEDDEKLALLRSD